MTEQTALSLEKIREKARLKLARANIEREGMIAEGVPENSIVMVLLDVAVEGVATAEINGDGEEISEENLWERAKKYALEKHGVDGEFANFIPVDLRPEDREYRESIRTRVGDQFNKAMVVINGLYTFVNEDSLLLLNPSDLENYREKIGRMTDGEPSVGQGSAAPSSAPTLGCY